MEINGYGEMHNTNKIKLDLVRVHIQTGSDVITSLLTILHHARVDLKCHHVTTSAILHVIFLNVQMLFFL